MVCMCLVCKRLSVNKGLFTLFRSLFTTFLVWPRNGLAPGEWIGTRGMGWHPGNGLAPGEWIGTRGMDWHPPLRHIVY